MRNFLTISSISIIILLFTGCGQTVQPPLYNWGNYQYTSTAYGMYGERKEVLEKHITELQKIINESEAKNQRVAPGIYAEYGQILFETNKKAKAKKYFILEQTTYPESTIFINRVLIKLYGEQK
jgi:hypothetical protein